MPAGEVAIFLIKKTLSLKQYLTWERAIVAVGFLVAMVLNLTMPVQMPDPDDWAYYNGVRNFSDGRLTVNNLAEYEQARDTMRQGGTLLQYLPLDNNKWALEKAPGYVFYLVLFYEIGIPRFGNILLSLGMVIVTFVLLKRLQNERVAMIGSLLTLFTPIAMVMLNRAYMETYSCLAFMVIGGGMYLYYHLERQRLSVVKGGILLFFAFLFIGWSVITRYTNLPIAVILALHLVITRFVSRRRGEKVGFVTEILPVALGIGLPMAAILLYNNYVFGSPLNYGYAVSPYPIKFAFQYLGQVDPFGESIPLQIVRNNAGAFVRNLFIGFPLLVIGIPGFVMVLYYKCAAFFKKDRPEGKWSSLRSELPWDILLVLIGWFIPIFLLYLCYEWTAGLKEGGGFVIFNRFLVPGLLPVVIICALIMDRIPLKVMAPVLLILIIFGSLLYAQWTLDLHILPQWLTESTLESRWPGYMFPPWTPYFVPGGGPESFPFPLWSYRYMFPMR